MIPFYQPTNLRDRRQPTVTTNAGRRLQPMPPKLRDPPFAHTCNATEKLWKNFLRRQNGEKPGLKLWDPWAGSQRLGDRGRMMDLNGGTVDGTAGSQRWEPGFNSSLGSQMKCPLPGANKRFLINTLKNAIPSQRQTYDRRQREEAEDLDLQEKEHRKKKKNHENSFQPYKQGSKSRMKSNRSPSPRKNDSKRTTKKYKGTNDY
ncbi:uncharacterized protein [Scyliorhinus torazame]|uniref:uncharacterized protein isoform X2 n=1 Tax=Scyliorhinus torazame TaxID=75743 RepID=UPI003B5BD3D5